MEGGPSHQRPQADRRNRASEDHKLRRQDRLPKGHARKPAWPDEGLAEPFGHPGIGDDKKLRR